MKWIKKGLVFATDHNYPWMVSHAQVPIVDRLDEERLRIYFGVRDASNQTTTTFIEVDASNPSNVLRVHNQQVLSLGRLGCFDDSGAMPSWLVNRGSEKWLYYIGWNAGVTVPYRNSIGLAISVDGGSTFERAYDGPIIDRTFAEPHFVGSSCVLSDSGTWRMWYLSTVRWEFHDGKPEPYYHIKYAESKDGVVWQRDGRVCIDFRSPEEGGISRPCVIKDGSLYRMWYSYRGGVGYRTRGSQSYRIGYAESPDGLTWQRLDDLAGIDISESGWDSYMIEYPYVFDHLGSRYLFYNGNGFGRSGLGYAVLDAENGN